MGLDEELRGEFYAFDVPGMQRWSVSRSLLRCKASLVYKEIALEIGNTPNFFQLQERVLAPSGWLRAYQDHPVVAKHPAEQVVPLALYMDGVPFLKRDSCLGFWVTNLVTDRRHLAVVLRKREFCRCGCRAWCSIGTAHAVLEWLLAAMAEGIYPVCKHTGQPWDDDANLELSGQPLGFRGAVVMIKGDWAELSTGLGLPTWALNEHPCFKCHCTGGAGGDMRNWEGSSIVALPFRDKTPEEYNQACADAEIRITLESRLDLEMLIGRLDYDKRKNGSHGRALEADLPELGLAKGDRLEPCPACPEIGALENVSEFPCELLFWRPSATRMVNHRCPLFTERTGLNLSRIVVDEMHTLHQSVFPTYILAVLWGILEAGCYEPAMRLGKLPGQQQTMLRIRSDLMTWYRVQREKHPEKPLYSVDDFVLADVGTYEKPVLRFKAAQTGTLVPFALSLAQKFRGTLPNGDALVRAGSALVKYLEVTRSNGSNLVLSAMQAIRGLVEKQKSLLGSKRTSSLQNALRTQEHFYKFLYSTAVGSQLFSGRGSNIGSRF